MKRLSAGKIAKRILHVSGALFGILAVGALVTALVLAASPPPPMPPPSDVFDFAALRGSSNATAMPGLRRFAARDKESLAYRFYDSSSDRLLIFIHGSSYHGASYHALASFISESGAAKVVLPNLRGHFQSGRRRGDVEYVGQLEDDLTDLIHTLRSEGLRGPVTLGGHSSGGGLAIRYAGGASNSDVSSFLLLSPIIPISRSVRGGSAGGWAIVHLRRLYGLVALGAIGIHGLDALPIVTFNKPAELWDGTETLSYSYRLNTSLHPRYRFADDLRALPASSLAMVGQNDQSIDPELLRAEFTSYAPRTRVDILPNINHFEIFSDKGTLETITKWLKEL